MNETIGIVFVPLEKLENGKCYDSIYKDIFMNDNHKLYHSGNACMEMLSDRPKLSKKSPYKTMDRMKLFFRFVLFLYKIRNYNVKKSKIKKKNGKMTRTIKIISIV